MTEQTVGPALSPLPSAEQLKAVFGFGVEELKGLNDSWVDLVVARWREDHPASPDDLDAWLECVRSLYDAPTHYLALYLASALTKLAASSSPSVTTP